MAVATVLANYQGLKNLVRKKRNLMEPYWQFAKPKFPRFPFSWGLTREQTNLQGYHEFYSLIISDHLIQNICQWTSLYIESNASAKEGPYEKNGNRWPRKNEEIFRLTHSYANVKSLDSMIIEYEYFRRYFGNFQCFFKRQVFFYKNNLRFFDDQELTQTIPSLRFDLYFSEILTGTNELHKSPSA